MALPGAYITLYLHFLGIFKLLKHILAQESLRALEGQVLRSPFSYTFLLPWTPTVGTDWYLCTGKSSVSATSIPDTHPPNPRGPEQLPSPMPRVQCRIPVITSPLPKISPQKPWVYSSFVCPMKQGESLFMQKHGTSSFLLCPSPCLLYTSHASGTRSGSQDGNQGHAHQLHILCFCLFSNFTNASMQTFSILNLLG